MAHADEMAPLLHDLRLHTFIGGQPETLPDLRQRYRRQVGGQSSNRSQRWLNWVVRRRRDGQAVGTMQATITEPDHVRTAQLAWVVATKYQGQGYARESAQALMAWLREHDIQIITAYMHPDHQASHNVARAVGLTPTTTLVDGGVCWRG